MTSGQSVLKRPVSSLFVGWMNILLLTLIVFSASFVKAESLPPLFDPTSPGNTSLLDEDFTGTTGTVPAGWTSSIAGGWEISNTAQTGLSLGPGQFGPGAQTGTIPVFNGGFIWHDDSDNTTASLRSPIIDLSTATDPYLTFDAHSFLFNGAERNSFTGDDFTFPDGAFEETTNKSYLQINVLDNAGAYIDTVFEIGDTDANGAEGWFDFVVRLADFIGQQIQLEFLFVNGPQSQHDIALDNVGVADVPAPVNSPLLDIRGINFYLPVSSADFTVTNTHLYSNTQCTVFGAASPQDTATEYTSITIGATELDGAGNPSSAIVQYDHVEDGFERSARRRQVTTEIWGDADPSNGFPPGYPADELFPGDIIILNTVSDPGQALQDDGAGGTEPAVLGAEIVGFNSTQQFDLNYDAGDRLRSASGLVITRAGWNDATSTLLAGANEVQDTAGAGTIFNMPIGEDLSSSGLVPDSFEYVGASIMAFTDNTTVTLPDGSTVSLDRGETHFVNGGIMVDDVISANRNIQVNVLAGELCTGFEGRWLRISPTRLFDSELFTPVNGAGSIGGSTVLLYNPDNSPISVQVFSESGLLTTVSVPANSTVRYEANQAGSGYRFVSTNGSLFYATQTYDTSNTTRDWGIALLGLDQLSPTLQAGLALGVDPTSGNTTVIASPIWVTSIWNGPGAAPGSVSLCVDWNGDGGPNLAIPGDPNSDTYDTIVTSNNLDSYLLDESESPPTNDLTGTRIYSCNPGNPSDPNLAEWLLAGAWGQDTSGPGGSPSIDVGTTIFNLPSFDMEKDINLVDDDNGNGIIDVGDTIEYVLTVTNSSSIPIRSNQLKIWDNLPAGLDYVENSTFITPELAPVTGNATEQVPDDGGAATNTAFPLDDADDSNLLFDDPNNLLTDTNQDGVWFNRLLPGFGTIVFTFQANVLEIPANNKVVNTALVTDGRFVKTDEISFEIPEYASIGDRVWLDEDGDGVQDAGENGIAGVPVTLTYTVQSPAGSQLITVNTITDADGGYIFRDLPVLPVGETYTVTITPPTGLDATFEEDGSLNSSVVLVSDPLSVNTGNPLAIQPGEEHTTTDFGLNWVPPGNTNNNTGVGAIGDRIWSDADGDGVQDPGEAGIEGVTINLFTDADGDGVYDTPAGTTTTDANGNYIFDDLPADAYVVEVDNTTLPAGLTQSGDPDDYGTTPLNPDDRTTTPIVLAPGDVYVNADFGYTGLTNTIGDTVWLDGDGDGVVDTGEPGFEGVSVVLLADIDGDGTFDDVVATTNTDENGNYLFTGVPDGDYQVWVNDADNVLREFNQISDPDGTLDNRNDVSVAGGVDVDTADFGYAPPDSDPDEGLIGDTVFLDYDGDGAADPGEGIEGVRLELYDEFGRLVGVTVTNENGTYAFGDLPATIDGNYRVVVDQSTLPTGITQTVDPDGTNDSESETPLGDGEQIYTIDFGYVPTDPASLSGTLWEDTDADGILDAAEAERFEGVTIVLTETVTETVTVTDPVTLDLITVDVTRDRVIGTTTTDASGDYSFDNLPPGDYTVRVSDDANVVGGYWHSDAPTPGTDNQSQNDEGYQVTLAAGETNTTADFGYFIDPGVVGNYIWADDGDGIQEGNESGIGGVEVTMDITYPNGTVITLVTLTSDGATDVDGDGVIDPLGFYSFGNLLIDEDYNGDGSGAEPSYEISVDQTSAVNMVSLVDLIPTFIQAGANTQVDSNDPAGSAAQPVQGQSDVSFANDSDPAAGIDFGFQQGGSITGNVSQDTNFDGNGDTDLVGVTVDLIQRFEVIDSSMDINGDGVITGADDGFFAGFQIINGRFDINGDGLANGADDGIVSGVTINNSRIDINGDGSTNSTNRPFDDGIFETIVDTQLTDGNGDYSFDDLPAGEYIVVETNPAGLIDLSDQDDSNDGDTADSDTTVDNEIGVTLDPGEIDADNNFVDVLPFGSIGDFVWNDTDGDGVQDAGEEGINGVTVNLLDAGGSVIATVTTTNHPTTGEPGYYIFENLQPGDYEVEFVTPTGFTFSPSNQTTDSLDSDANLLTGRTGTVSVAAGQDITDVDAGMVPGGSIGDHIWLDTDGDGVDDIGEQGLPNVTIELTGTATDGTAITLTTVTDANGDYLFDNLPPGNYTVTVTDTNGELTNLAQSPGNTGSEAVTLAAGEDFLDADFGYVPAAGTAVIGDTVWADEDGDGIQDPGEVGIAGVTLDLVDENGTVVDTITTDASGNYLFTNVTPGDYTVVVTDTGGVIDDPATNVTNGPQSPGSLTSTPITVLPDDVYVDADFGFTAQTGSTLADRIWYDADGDGVQDAGEPGIGNVTVDLLDSNGVIIASVVTDSNGDFAFTGLPDGDYSIVITDDNDELTGYFPTTPPASALRQEITGLSGDIVNQDPTTPNPVTTGSGTGHPSFGFNQPGTIGDTIWNDANGDGVQDPGEGGLAGVTLTLTDSNGAIVDTAVTDSNGNYLFTNVPAGTDYMVTVDSNNFSGGGALDGYTQTYDADDGLAANDNNSVLSLAPGESNLNQDFGYQNTALPNISGTVFYDVDTDGTHEPDGNDTTAGNSDDENGIAGVTIDLVDSNGNVVATTTTDVNGDYSFPNVPPADYTVEVTDTSSVLDGYELTSGLDILPVSETQLNAGDVTDVDFGYVDDEQTASITSGLWIDSDKDGVRDPDETPIPNVDINLIDCGPDAICGNGDDTIVGTASTDVDGNVIFEDLPPGVYALDSIESDPDFPADITEIGNYSPNFNNPNDTIQLSEGETYDADFGYIPDPGTAGLSGTLWNDSEPDGSEGDGIQDASEVGLGGIPVQLTDTATGATVATTTTAPDGSFEFTGLAPCPGTDPCYALTYDEPSVTALGLDGVEPTNTPDEHALDGTTTPDGVNDNIYLIHLEDGDFKEDHDFGFDAPANTFGAIEGYTYYEPAPANNDRDGSDTGIESVTVNLVDSNGDLVATTTTSDGFTDVNGDGVIDPAGFYSFTNLLPGDYTVVVTDINNATIGLNPTENPTGTSPTLTVPAGGLATADFGYTGEQSLGNIGSLIWFDVGGPALSDGLFDPTQGDKGIAGVTVECWYDTDGDKALTIAGEDNLIRTVTTDANGEYFCEGLPTGGYLVRVTDDAGRLTGAIAANLPAGGSLGTDGIAGTRDDLDEANKMAIPLASIPTSGASPAWYIQTGSDNLTADFAITGTNSLSGTVFEEEAGTTANGQQDGSDAGTPGVTVILLVQQPDGTYVELTRTTTDANGDYDFTGLPNGNYQVVVDTDGSSINGYGQTADPDIQGGFCTSALASICDDMAGSQTPIALTGGTAVTDVDFGYQTEFVTTPITLGYFHAQSLGGGTVEINWQTVTEVAHLGFNLYVRERVEGETKRSWRRLNAELIAPAAPGDSFDTREYTFTAYAVNGKRFAIGDVDVTGKETIHGPV